MQNGPVKDHQLAAAIEAREVAKVLLDSGADPNARNKIGSTPLQLAKWKMGKFLRDYARR